jgi:hypothetical protein
MGGLTPIFDNSPPPHFSRDRGKFLNRERWKKIYKCTEFSLSNKNPPPSLF